MIFLLFIPFAGIAYLFMIFPGKRRQHPILSVQFYAHRGLHTGGKKIPENSMKAFRKAKEQGIGIELDVRLTKDQVVVVHHDPDLNRSCGANVNIADLTYEQLLAYHLWESKEQIPRFADVLKEIDGRVPLLIEIKMESINSRLCQLTAEFLDGYQGLYCMESFHPYALWWFRRKRPGVIRGQLGAAFNREKKKGNHLYYFVLEYLLSNCMTRPDFIAYKYKQADGLSVKLCRQLFHTPLYGWTFRSQKAYESYKDGFDGFIFERFLLS